jgi:hypothetical protein
MAVWSIDLAGEKTTKSTMDAGNTPPREEDSSMTERQKEAWSGVLLTVLLVGLLLGGLLVLRLTGN